MIVPTGIATDTTTAPYFAHIVQMRRLVAYSTFEMQVFFRRGKCARSAILSSGSEPCGERTNRFLLPPDSDRPTPRD